ncbi:uncharacterized protein LOC109949727 [Prunus persica]|uniref:uncharacterized protein LOC109949727 n=1 Tax=Prunus persica TaxID=3760 RepID=UPI0009AB778D|nr:uncharacterized protein LOC109949727 [Prunus persica]
MSYMMRCLERQEREMKERSRRQVEEEREEEEDDEKVAICSIYQVKAATVVHKSTVDRRRMQPHLFNKIMHDVCNYNAYFIQKCDATGILGLLLEQKLTASLRILAFGTSANQVDEITRKRKSTILESLVRFCDVIETFYTRDYLRKPTLRDLQRLLQKAEARDFPSMIGSIDCMHWQWKNCPTAWQGDYGNKKGQKVSFFKLLHHSIHEFGMPFSELRDLKTTSTCWVNPLCSTMC